MIIMYWNTQRHNWQLQENQTGISTNNCSNVRIKSSARNDYHPPSHKLKDYSVWSILQEKVYKTRITDINDLKHRIRTEWAGRRDPAWPTVGQAGSRHHCCSCASVASTSFSLCEGGWWSFQALLLILTFEQLSVDILVWFSCSCQLWCCAFSYMTSFNSQGKVVTLIRCGGLLLC